MAITVKRYNTAPRQIGAGRIDPGFANPLIRDASQNGTRDLVDAMLKAGMQITEVGIREYVKSESTAVSEALQEYRESLAAERERYTKANQGKNAVNAGAHFDQFARETAGPLAERFSGRFKEMFLKDAAAQGLHFTEQGRAYGNQQRQAWKKSVFDGDMAQTMNEIAADPTNAEYVHASLTALKERHAMMFPGLDQRAFEADVNRKVAGLTIDSLLAKDNISGARTALGEYRELLGVAAPQYEARILAAGRAAQARAEAERNKAVRGIMSGASEAEYRAKHMGDPQALQEMALQLKALGATEEAAKIGSAARFWQSHSAAADYGATASLVDVDKRIAETEQSLKAEGLSAEEHKRLTGELSALSAVYKERVQAYGKDPAQAALAEVQRMGALPENATAEDIMLASLRRQEEVGVPAASRRALTVAQVEQQADALLAAPDPSTALQDLQTQSGQAWPQVERDLASSKKLPAWLSVAASGMTGRPVKLLAEAARNPEFEKQAQAALALSGSSKTAFESSVRAELADFSATLRAQGGNAVAVETSIFDATSRLALQYLLQGDDQSDAIERAAQDVVLSRYHLDGTYRVPQQYDADVIRAGGQTSLQSVAEATRKGDEGAAFVPTNSALGAEHVQGRYADAITANAQWRTLPDESGLGLYYGLDPVLDKDGKPISRTWAELTQAGQGQTPDDLYEDYTQEDE